MARYVSPLYNLPEPKILMPDRLDCLPEYEFEVLHDLAWEINFAASQEYKENILFKIEGVYTWQVLNYLRKHRFITQPRMSEANPHFAVASLLYENDEPKVWWMEAHSRPEKRILLSGDEVASLGQSMKTKVSDKAPLAPTENALHLIAIQQATAIDDCSGRGNSHVRGGEYLFSVVRNPFAVKGAKHSQRYLQHRFQYSMDTFAEQKQYRITLGFKRWKKKTVPIIVRTHSLRYLFMQEKKAAFRLAWQAYPRKLDYKPFPFMPRKSRQETKNARRYGLHPVAKPGWWRRKERVPQINLRGVFNDPKKPGKKRRQENTASESTVFCTPFTHRDRLDGQPLSLKTGVNLH